MTILLLDSYFKIKWLTIQGYFGSFSKNSLNLISFLPIPPNFEKNENLRS